MAFKSFCLCFALKLAQQGSNQKNTTFIRKLSPFKKKKKILFPFWLHLLSVEQNRNFTNVWFSSIDTVFFANLTFAFGFELKSESNKQTNQSKSKCFCISESEAEPAVGLLFTAVKSDLCGILLCISQRASTCANDVRHMPCTLASP